MWYTWLKFSSRGGHEDAGSSSNGSPSSGSGGEPQLPPSTHPHTSYAELPGEGQEGEAAVAVAVAGGAAGALSSVRGRR